MRAALLLVLCCAATAAAAVGQSAKPPVPAPAPPTFTKDIAPLLNAKCQPCHFKGGQCFSKLPFDQYETVKTLGLKLNTRLKDADADLAARWVAAKSPK